MKRKVCELVLIVIFYLLQVSVGRVIAVANIVPNFLIILPIIFGFLKGRNEGMFVGFFAGVMYDLYFSSLFGFTALCFVYIGYYAGFFYEKYEKYEILIPMAMVLVFDFVYEFLCYIGNFLLHNRLNAGFFISRIIIPEVVYTCLCTLILYKLLAYINDKLDTVKTKKRGVNFDEGSIWLYFKYY